jgi:hypothetical protein
MMLVSILIPDFPRNQTKENINNGNVIIRDRVG